MSRALAVTSSRRRRYSAEQKARTLASRAEVRKFQVERQNSQLVVQLGVTSGRADKKKGESRVRGESAGGRPSRSDDGTDVFPTDMRHWPSSEPDSLRADPGARPPRQRDQRGQSRAGTGPDVPETGGRVVRAVGAGSEMAQVGRDPARRDLQASARNFHFIVTGMRGQ